MTRRLAALLLAAALCGAARAQDATPGPVPDPVYVPGTVGEFTRSDFRRFDDPALGYSYRFTDAAGGRWIDLYVYPVPDAIRGENHGRRVEILVALARSDIRKAVAEGIYLSQSDLGLEGFEVKEQVIAKSRHRLATAHGELYSVIYLTETADRAVKVRVSAPETAATAVSEGFEDEAMALLLFVMDALGRR